MFYASFHYETEKSNNFDFRKLLWLFSKRIKKFGGKKIYLQIICIVFTDNFFFNNDNNNNKSKTIINIIQDTYQLNFIKKENNH